MQKPHNNTPGEKGELPAAPDYFARVEAQQTGRPYAEIAARNVAVKEDRADATEVRAYASPNTRNQPDPIDGAGRPHTPAAGPRDAKILAHNTRKAQGHYAARGDSRDACQVVTKSPEWGRWAHEAYWRPEWALGKMPAAVRAELRACAYAKGHWCEWGRALVSVSYLVFRLAQKTRRPGVQVVAGVSAGLLASCIPSLGGRRSSLHRNTLLARHHHGAARVPGTEGRRGALAGDCMRHECGQLEALNQIGILFLFQPRSDAVPKWQLGSRGYACFQYVLPDSLWRQSAPGDADPDPPTLH